MYLLPSTLGGTVPLFHGFQYGDTNILPPWVLDTKVHIENWGDNINYSWLYKAFKNLNDIQINDLDAPNLSIVSLESAFENCPNFNSPLNNWNISTVLYLKNTFRNATSFNQPLDNWNTSNVVNMDGTFENSAFNQAINSWDVFDVTTMYHMFKDNQVFNQPLNNWITSNVINMESMFSNGIFNQPINSWDVGKVWTFWGMFSGNTAFNQPLDNWDVSSAEWLANMFANSIFNQPIGNWDVSNAKQYGGMFSYNTALDQDISGWSTTSALNMNRMFEYNSYNRNIGSWNVSSVEGMDDMFSDNPAFNQDISGWDVSNVTNTSQMFLNASAFDQNLGNWNLNNIILASIMLNNSGLSCENYSFTLDGWANNPDLPTGISLESTAPLQYGNPAQEQRDKLTTTKTWTISGDVLEPTCIVILPVLFYSFDLKQINGVVELKWATSQESVNHGFEIERSFENSSFVKVGFVASKAIDGNATDEIQYSYLDESVSNGKYLYRLKQIDQDGNFTYSTIQSITINSVDEIKIYPNPATNQITIQRMGATQQPIPVIIFDINGRIIEKLQINRITHIPIIHWKSGVYFIKFANGMVKRVIKN